MAAKVLLLASLVGVVLSLPQNGYNYSPPAPQQPPSNLYQQPSSTPPRRPTRPAPPAPQTDYGLPSAASSNIPQNAPPGGMEGMPYDFQWGVEDSDSGNYFSHVETSDGQTTQGEYRVLLPDGRTQVVKFFDDGNGYNAEVTYE